MDLSAFKTHGPKALLALLALSVAAGTTQAANLVIANPTTVSLTCSTATGPGTPVTVIVKPVAALTGTNTLAVTVGATSGGVIVTPPADATLRSTNSSTGLAFQVKLANGCAGVTTGAPTFRFATTAGPDATVTVNTTLTATASGLSASPVTITCARSAGGVYTPGTAANVAVTSAAVGGTAFTVDTTTVAPPAWLVVTPTTGGTATSSPVIFTVAAASGCGGFAAGSTNTATLHLLNSPAPDKTVNVTLQVLPPSPLTAADAKLTYVKGSGNAGKVDVAISSASNPAPFFAVDTSSLPSWLTVDSTTGITPRSLRFTSTSVADTLAPGTYTSAVRFKVSGYADLSVSISLNVTNAAPKLTVGEGTTRNISWVLGQPLPTPVITAFSSDSPIAYSAVAGGTLAPIIPSTQQKGLAYSFGTPISVSFDPLVFASAQPGSTLTGTVTLTWGSPASTIVVTLNVAVVSPGAAVTGVSPATIPTAAPGQVFTVVVSGSGFVPSTDPSQKTKVGIIVGGTLVSDTNIAANVVNPSNIILTITVPANADAYLPFSPTGTGGVVNLGVCNPVNGSCSIATGTATLAIGSNPIIQAVTSSAAFIQVNPPALQTVAPYDIISVFGTNFCTSGGTGCSSSQILYGTPDPTTLRYPLSLSPDATGATQRSLSVTFQTQGASPSVIGTAPLLFATNGQINILVPAAMFAQIGNSVDMVVNFGYGTGATLKSSTPFPLSVVATNPGVFTVGANGQGDGAILNSSYAVITAANAAGMRSTAADSDSVQLYVTGLGAPDSSADNASAGSSAAWSTDCVTTASFLASLNAQTSASLANLDGTVIQSSLLNTNRLVPCILSTSANVPSVTVGGVAATVLYAGWVPDTIAGLYQINVKLPGSTAGSFTTAAGTSISTITAPVQLPVVITAAGKTSQSGVTMWVAPRLKVAPPTGGGLTGTVGTLWASSNNLVVATEGTSPYRYALSSGLLPSGLSLNATTGAIAGTPGANTAGSYIVTVTATDSANVPVTGATTFTITVAGGLVLTSSGNAPYSGVFGTANASVTTVQAAGGLYPYTYAITAPGTLPTGMTINAATGVIGTTALTPAGTYTVTVTGTDAAGTPLSGTITFDIVVGLQMSRTAPQAGANGVASNISTVSALGATGSVTYALDSTTAALGWVTINSSTGVVAITTGAPAATTVTATVTATDGTTAPHASAAGTGTITVAIVIN